MKKLTLMLLVGLFLTVTILSDVLAMPSFARKYRMSCTTCHQPFPRLKAYGDEFAGNAFQLEDQENPRYYVDTGDTELSLIRELGFAVRFDSWIFNDGTNNKATDFRMPYGVKLLSGGALSDKLAYYFYFFMNERGAVAGLEDAFVMYNNAFGMDFDIYAGQFQVSDPLFKRELRLTLEDYPVYKMRPGNSGIDLTYDRGLMFTLGLPSGTGFTLELLNGNGIGGTYADHSFDSDAHKSIFLHGSQDVGEMFRIGGMGYMGSEEAVTGTTNDVLMFGVDGTLSMGPFELNGQWIHRNDNDPTFGGAAAQEVDSDGMMVELVYWPHGDESRWFCSGLYNNISSDDDAIAYQSGTLHYGYLVRRNVRIGVEGTYDMEQEKFRGGLGMVVAF